MSETPTPKPREKSQWHVLKHHKRPRADGNSVTSAGALPAEFYEICGTVTAATSRAAVAKHCEANKDATDLTGTYLAVKVDDWRPIPAAAKRETVLEFGGGS